MEAHNMGEKKSCGGFFDFLGKAAVGALIGVFCSNKQFRDTIVGGCKTGANKVKDVFKKKKTTETN